MSADPESSWPTPQTALAELQDREFQARRRAHYKGMMADTSEKFAKAKAIAAEQDKARSWRRR